MRVAQAWAALARRPRSDFAHHAGTVRSMVGVMSTYRTQCFVH